MDPQNTKTVVFLWGFPSPQQTGGRPPKRHGRLFPQVPLRGGGRGARVVRLLGARPGRGVPPAGWSGAQPREIAGVRGGGTRATRVRSFCTLATCWGWTILVANKKFGYVFGAINAGREKEKLRGTRLMPQRKGTGLKCFGSMGGGSTVVACSTTKTMDFGSSLFLSLSLALSLRHSPTLIG